MAETKNDGGQAFPQPLTFDAGGIAIAAYPGMSLRDWFAGQALAGLLAADPEKTTWSGDAENAYRAADAMLAERSR